MKTTELWFGLKSIFRKIKLARAVVPQYVVNWIFQRCIGVNGNCRWSVHFTSRVSTPGKLKLHASVGYSLAMSGGCYIQAANGLTIEEGTIFAPGVKIISANHTTGRLETWDSAPPIVIGRRCWIGANAVILPGVQLGDGVIVGAGSVVTKSVPANTTVAGVPARPIRIAGRRFQSCEGSCFQVAEERATAAFG
jgi:acetyltransferase-like isoleucine patch superfamily enzyme